ncbi:MAG: hypothetical protein KF746_11640 [Chitinophagaceae bacterium]|nr:hypothetical protein [Chitinophagaceae bacterium]
MAQRTLVLKGWLPYGNTSFWLKEASPKSAMLFFDAKLAVWYKSLTEQTATLP